ncbi:hypothetical protein TCAL_11511 [Tigriopus californicus]|uniref:Thioredoxin domain-containing protein n=1 Tax=Tigriopus californicus TaxID=6832 RepID=A0A553N9R0_TIGCA|nr:uncharacterized protein LOC131885667 isoform X2 [Tigriopus californicus]TRY62181.1 hypothetical protein TCAL_11511 [Tigriopus californicus]
MDIGRDILTNTLLGSKDWEKVFSPWWITVHHYLVYSLVVLGLIALPINCMISVQGNCSYHPAHPRNYVLPMKICRMNEELSQIVIEKRYCTTKQRNVLNETFGIIATQEDSVFEYQTIRNIAFMSEMWKAAKAKEHTTNFNNCLLKMNPRAFPFHLYYACVNQLDALALYFPYLVLTLALFLVILERLCTRYLWTGRRIEKFYELLVKDIIEEGGSKAMNSLEQRQKCQQIIYDFMNSSFLCGSYIVQTTIKVLVCLSVLIWSIMGMCHSLRESFKTDFNCEQFDYMHACSITSNGMNIVLFDLCNIVVALILLDGIFNVFWHYRFFCSTNTQGSILVPKTKLDRLILGFVATKEGAESSFMNTYFGSPDLQMLMNLLAAKEGIWAAILVLSAFDANFKSQFKVRDCKMGSHSSEVSGKRKDATISWNEPHAASFIGENVPTEHLMYVLEINPPIDWHKQGDNVTMVPACADDGECIFNPLVVSTDWDGKTTSSLASALTTLERESEEVKQIPKLDKSSSKDSVFSGYSVNNNATEAIVSGTHANGRNLLATHLYKSSMARNQTEQRTTASRSFKHAFVGLRMDTDYKITLKFVLSGRALGSEAFTILSHDGESRKTSAVSNSDSNLNSSLASRTTRNQWIQANNDTELTAMLEDCAAQSDRVILDFEAKWCPNCRNLQEALKELPSRCQVKHSVFIQADVDECPKVSASFQFSTLPALFVLKEGQIDHCMMGKGALEHGPEIITKLCALDE